LALQAVLNSKNHNVIARIHNIQAPVPSQWGLRFRIRLFCPQVVNAKRPVERSAMTGLIFPVRRIFAKKKIFQLNKGSVITCLQRPEAGKAKISDTNNRGKGTEMAKEKLNINEVLGPYLDQFDEIRRDIKSACNRADWLTATAIVGHLEAIIFEFNQQRAYMLAQKRKETFAPENDEDEATGPYENR
jgi:hypothetical protein